MNFGWLVRISLIVQCSLTACFSIASAQLTVALQMDPFPSPYVSDWRSNMNTIRVIISNASGKSQDVRVEGFIEGEQHGRVAETKLDAAISPIVVQAAGSTILTAAEARVLEEDVIRYIGAARRETITSGRLPEDRYKLCVRLVEYGTPHAPLSPQTCASFRIVNVQPPDLIAPLNASTVAVPPAFRWSMVTTGTQVLPRYEFRLIELDQSQDNVAAAFETNAPILVKETNIPVLVYSPADPPLQSGKRYAWNVRAFDPDNRLQFARDGKSQIWLFTYGQGQAVPGIEAGSPSARGTHGEMVNNSTSKETGQALTRPVIEQASPDFRKAESAQSGAGGGGGAEAEPVVTARSATQKSLAHPQTGWLHYLPGDTSRGGIPVEIVRAPSGRRATVRLREPHVISATIRVLAKEGKILDRLVLVTHISSKEERISTLSAVRIENADFQTGKNLSFDMAFGRLDDREARYGVSMQPGLPPNAPPYDLHADNAAYLYYGERKSDAHARLLLDESQYEVLDGAVVLYLRHNDTSAVDEVFRKAVGLPVITFILPHRAKQKYLEYKLYAPELHVLTTQGTSTEVRIGSSRIVIIEE